MKKIIIIIITFLLIPFTIYIINDIKDKDVFPESDFTTIETDSSFIHLNNNSFNDVFSTNLLLISQLTLDTPITDLDNHTLREVFEDSTTPKLENLVMNGDFSDGISGWTGFSASLSAVGGNLIVTGNETSTSMITFQDILPLEHVYIKTRVRTTSADVTSIQVRDSTGNLMSIITNPTQNTWYDIAFGGLADTVRYTYRLYATDTNTKVMEIDYSIVFNITASHSITETSGTAYDKAVAELEWFLSINNGYLQNQVNWFEIVDLTVEQMDYYYSLYNSLKNNLSLPNEITYNIYTNDDIIIDLSSLISNNQYSPMYNTNFDLMTTEQIKLQMDEFIEKSYLFIDYESFGISSITTVQMDMYYSYYLNDFNNVTFGNTVSGYTNLQSLMSQNADLDYKLYIKDLSSEVETIQNKRYKLIQNDDNILVSDINDNYLMAIYDDNTYISNISIDNLEFTFEGYNSIGTIAGSIPTITQPFLLIIPLFLIVGFIFLVLKEE